MHQLRTVAQHDRSALFRGSEGDAAPDTLGRTRHNDNFVLKSMVLGPACHATLFVENFS
jgi:hypothetical protein